MANFNSQYFGSTGGGGIAQWDPLTDPTKIVSGKETSPGFFVLLNGYSGIIDDVSNPTYRSTIFFDKNKNRWQFASGPEHNLGIFLNLTELQAKYPVGGAGSNAYLQSTQTVYYWNTSTNAWTNTGSGALGGALTVSDIVDDFLSTSTTKVASANSVRVLNNAKISTTSIVIDFNSTDDTKVSSARLAKTLNDNKVDKQNIINDFTTGGVTNVASAQTVKDLNTLKADISSVYVKNETLSTSEINALVATKVSTSLLSSPNGVATLGSDGKILSNQLPSYVDDVLEFPTFSSFPSIGESSKIYIAVDTNMTYRWGGSVYVVMSTSLALGETDSTAYRGDRGKIAYDHSQTTGNPHGVTKADVGLGNCNNTADIDKIISSATQSALDLKASHLGQNTIVTVGTVVTGTWTASPISDSYIASSSIWNAKLDLNSTIDGGSYA